MFEMLVKMYAITKKQLILEYGEQFTGMTEKEQAGAVIKILSDLVQIDPTISAALAERYVKEAE